MSKTAQRISVNTQKTAEERKIVYCFSRKGLIFTYVLQVLLKNKECDIPSLKVIRNKVQWTELNLRSSYFLSYESSEHVHPKHE